MSRRCQVIKKKALVGNNVSHANNKTKRRFYPNIQWKRIFVPELGIWVRVKISTKAMKYISKHGPYKVLKEAGLLDKYLNK